MTPHYRNFLATSAALALSAGLAQADQVIADDLIVDGSACIGLDCVANMSFGFDTLVLRENNLRMLFDDTSTSASFPKNDWRLIANDSSNGGDSKFSLEDVTGGRIPFTVIAGAPSNSLYVDSQGDVGLNNNNPLLELHITDGDSPTVRLEQDGSSGWNPQTWDMAGNETNFFIRDVTHGSKLPFRIRPDAPTNSLEIEANGDISLGGSASGASLAVGRSDGSAKIKVQESNGTATARTVAEFINNGRPDMVLANASTSKEWSIGGGTNMVFKSGALGSLPSAKTTRLTLFDTGNATLTGTLTTGGGTCGGGCDLVFTEDYDLPSISEHAEKMFSLGYLPNVGPTIENQPINVSDKLGRMLNELEHAHIYITHLEARDAELMARIETLEAALLAEKD